MVNWSRVQAAAAKARREALPWTAQPLLPARLATPSHLPSRLQQRAADSRRPCAAVRPGPGTGAARQAGQRGGLQPRVCRQAGDGGWGGGGAGETDPPIPTSRTRLLACLPARWKHLCPPARCHAPPLVPCAAPEQLLGQRCTLAADVYRCGRGGRWRALRPALASSPATSTPPLGYVLPCCLPTLHSTLSLPYPTQLWHPAHRALHATPLGGAGAGAHATRA
jgi:hypothetical protein